MKPRLQDWTHFADVKTARTRRTELLIVSRDTDFLLELGSILHGHYRVRTVDSAHPIAPPGTASHWLAIIDTVSPADGRADVAILQEQYPLAPIIVITNAPWQWSAAVARGNIIAAIAREELRGPRLTDALSAAERRLSSEHRVPTVASTPASLTRSALPLLGLLLLDIAFAAWWLLAEPNSDRGLRGLLLGASAVATLLLPMILYHLRRARELAAAAATAQCQAANILGSMREGLFLIRRDLRLGAICSGSLTEMLRLEAPAGRRFEDVLKPLLDPQTLAAALTFLRLLWKDEANEQAIESINPLSQVEVSFANAHGGSELRYLSFAFRRARGTEPAADCILGVVDDITDRVLLARELECATADGDSQAGLLLQQMRLDPLTLQAFLNSADIAFRKSNAMLTASGIGQQQLQKKLHGVRRELQTVKAEAAALTLASFIARLQRVEDTLSGLCAKSLLNGNDLLPVVVGLDELISHAATTRAIQAHIASLRAPPAASAVRPPRSGIEGLNRRDTASNTGPVVLERS
ncbi:MAG: hypothetical protein ACHP9X_02980 [Steroidobacterales bacterium]